MFVAYQTYIFFITISPKINAKKRRFSILSRYLFMSIMQTVRIADKNNFVLH